MADMADTAGTAERTVPLAVERVAFRAWLEGDDETWDSVLGTYRAVLADPEARAALVPLLDAVPRDEHRVLIDWNASLRDRAERAEAERDRYRNGVENIAYLIEDEKGQPLIPRDVYDEVLASIERARGETADGPPLPG